MKKLLAIMVGLFLSAGLGYAQAEGEVSEQKDIGITKTYSAQRVPETVLQQVDDDISAVFTGMNRFNVIGYQFTLDDTSAEQMITKIQELKQDEVLHDDDYMDEDLGIVILPANELRELVNAFFIVIPSISSYEITRFTVTNQTLDEKGNSHTSVEKKYQCRLSLSVKMINADGDLLDTYEDSAISLGYDTEEEAGNSAGGLLTGSMEDFLRNMDEFKIKTIVQGKVGVGMFLLELGEDMGIEPGYEFILKETLTTASGFSTSLDKGLLRIKEVTGNASFARVVWGSVDVGDQLVEAPLGNNRFSFYVNGVLPLIALETISFNANGSSWNYEAIDLLTQFGADLGFSFEDEIGFGGLFRASIGGLIASPWLLYFDLGGGRELFFRRLSFTPELLASFGLSVSGMESATDSGSMSLWQFYGGVKLPLNFNIQLSQTSKFRFGVTGFAYFPLGSMAYYMPSGSEAVLEGANIDVGSIMVNGSSAELPGTLFMGVQAGVEFIKRF